MKRTSLLIASTCSLFAVFTSASWAQPGIQCVQNQLNALGFSAGSADGSIGPKTRAAAEEYRNWMMSGAGGANWSQPPLTALNGEFWCDRVGDAHPAVAKYAVTAAPEIDQKVSTGDDSVVAKFTLAVAGRVTGMTLDFKFKTECENDHWAAITAPNGKKMILMDRGNGRCSGSPMTFDSENDLGSFFGGSNVRGSWEFEFKDLDSNFEQGVLEQVRVNWTVQDDGVTTEHSTSLAGVPFQVPNPS